MKAAIALALLTLAAAIRAQGQSAPTAIRPLQLSAFGGVSGVYTGLAGGRNLSITAGAGLGLPPWHSVRAAIDLRGTYPVDGGTIDGQESVLAGVDVEFLLNHQLRPYGDFLFGRGQMNYKSSSQANGYVFMNSVYALTTTYIDSPGAGFDYQFSRHLALKVDGQYQRWASAPTPSGTVYAKTGTVGLVYFFTFDRRTR